MTSLHPGPREGDTTVPAPTMAADSPLLAALVQALEDRGISADALARYQDAHDPDDLWLRHIGPMLDALEAEVLGEVARHGQPLSPCKVCGVATTPGGWGASVTQSTCRGGRAHVFDASWTLDASGA